MNQGARPLGATLRGLLGKPNAQGGMALSRNAASAAVAIVILAAIVVITFYAWMRCR